MNAEESWKAWWDAEGKRMERLPHHDAMDHMASVTRIAWLNGAFEAADEIERLREQLRLANIDNFNTTAEVERLRAERDEARREIIFLTCDICEEDECRFEVMDRARSKRGWEYLKENKENTDD